MAATAQIKWDGSEWTVGNDGSATMTFYVFFEDGDTEADVEAAALAAAPATYVGYFLSSVVLKLHGFYTYTAVCRYTSLPKPDTSGGTPPEFSFEITSQQVKVLASLAVVSSGTAAGKTIPDNGNLVGVQPDGTIDGVEVPQMAYTFSETHHFANAAITTAYKVTLAGLLGKVNNAAFKGFAAGEVLSTGVNGSQRGEDLWTLTFQFAVLPNISGLTVGPLTGIAKAGWEYIEWFTEEKENTTDKHVERELIGYRVHRVIDQANFASFGIGTT